MSLDTTLLRLLKSRERYDRLARAVPRSAIDVGTGAVLDYFKRYLAEHPDVPVITLEPFLLWHAIAFPSLDENDRGLVRARMHGVLGEDADPALESGIMERLLAAETANRVTDLITKYQEGAEVDLYNGLRAELDTYEQQTTRKVAMPWVRDSIDDILADDKDDRGLAWRLDCLNMVMRKVRPGDFIIIAGRPDKGKTTFVASEITYMAEQFDEYYGLGHGRSVLWFNNEGPGRRIVSRVYQSALGISMADMVKYSKDKSLASRYADKVGDLDRIRILDIHGRSTHEVEDIMRKMKPGLVIFDMVDNINFGGAAINGGQRTDQLLEAMYQWARLMGVKYDVPVIATSQISGDGDGVPFPTLSQLKDSKTGKQGAADVIVTLGASNESHLEGVRWIGLTKNKSHRAGAPKSPRAEVIFDGERARLNMPSEQA